MAERRKHFLFNYEWAEVLMDYPGEVRLEVYDAIIRYAQSGTLSELKPQAKMAFSFIKREIDYNNSQYQDTVNARKEAGSKGGKAKQSKQIVAKQANATFAKQSQANVADNDNDNDNDIDIIIPPTPPGVEPGWRQRLSESFFSKQSAIDGFCMKNGTTVDVLRELCEEIFDDWTLTDDKDKSEKHLLNTLRVKLRAKRTQTNETDKTDRFSERRGTEPKAKDRKTFDSSF